jgi:hypothetical protein
MEKEHHDYSIFLFAIAMWMMVGCLIQCDSARQLNDIRRELNGITHELNMMRHK